MFDFADFAFCTSFLRGSIYPEIHRAVPYMGMLIYMAMCHLARAGKSAKGAREQQRSGSDLGPDLGADLGQIRAHIRAQICAQISAQVCLRSGPDLGRNLGTDSDQICGNAMLVPAAWTHPKWHMAMCIRQFLVCLAKVNFEKTPGGLGSINL